MRTPVQRLVTRRQVALGLTACSLGLLAPPQMTRAQSTPAATPAADTFPATITHAMGETTIPARPERIVASSNFLNLDALLTLGRTPVAFGRIDPTVETLLPWQSAAAGLPTFDALGDVDLEAIAAAQPDLILTMPMSFDGWYETVSAIAPTVVLDWDAPWRDSLRLVGRVTGASERAEAEIADAERLLAQARAALAPAADLPLMVGFMYATEFWIWGEEMSAAQLFTELGLDFRGGEDPVMTITSPEQISLVSPAQILLSVLTDPAAIAIQEASPLFRVLPAVRRGGYGLLTVEQTSALADSISPLSLAWALPDFVALILQLAAGQGKQLS